MATVAEDKMILTAWNARQEFKAQGVDPRYTVDYCWCGAMNQRYMVSFCGDHIGNYNTESQAVAAAKQHNANRLQ